MIASRHFRFGFFALLFFAIALPLAAQDQKKKSKPKPPSAPFSWVSPLSEGRAKNLKLPEGVRHETFKSESMGIEVGYYIYLPPQYEAEADRKFPVIFHLHGGRPGSESKSVSLVKFVDAAIRAEQLLPAIYVFPNGGPLSWYNHDVAENGQGEDVFVNELVPHIDKSYRVSFRGIQGFSQGGRGTTRIMFKHPELWDSAAPGGSGYEPEERIKLNEGRESENLRILPIGYNAWDLAEAYAKSEPKRELPIMLWVGTKGFNYEYNLKFSKFLDGLGLPHEKLIVPEVPHSASGIYAKQGIKLMKFHERNFAKAAAAAAGGQ
ncbi:MAG: enterochelin esterase-like enzyme [Verrucomicrobiales bacterium]|jgi:enterochelin esterase-like enzyme